MTKRISKKSGQVVILTTIFFLVISSTIVFGFIAPAIRHIKVASNLLHSRESYFLAEAGTEDVLYRLKTSLPTSSSQSLSIDGKTVTTEIADVVGGKTIISEANWDDYYRKIRTKIIAGVGASFNYGLHVGNGGLQMDNNSSVVGNVYSNGDIDGSNGASVTGTAVAANSLAMQTDQINNSPLPPADSINFRNVSAAQDLAQSFQVSATQPINKIQFYVKKTGSPANATVLIKNNSSGNPGSSTLASGTLSASSVSTSYGWIDVTFTLNPLLTSGTTYWIVVDNGSQSPANYYTVGANTSYASGTAKVGQHGGTWNDTSPTGLDSYFSVSLGGVTSTIDNVVVGLAGVGDAWANAVTNSDVEGNLYCQTGSGNNKSCNTSQPDPSPIAFSLSDANIDQWKTEAADGGTISGDYTPVGTFSSLGPKKITGNLDVPLGHTLTVTGTIWVEGIVTIGNSVIVQLDPGFDENSGAIIADGRINLDNNIQFNGSGETGSYILLLTTSDCPISSSCGGNNAVTVSNNVGSIIINAQRGTVNVSNNAGAKEITAERIILGQNAFVQYESGLANINFSSGPGGAWNIVNWREIQ